MYNLYRPVMIPKRETALAETWQRTLSRIPAIPGRLAYLASLRNSNTGRYEHFGLAQRIGADEAEKLIRRSHVNLFQEWLCFGLERQKQEIEDYLDALEGDKREIIANWLSIEPCSAWIPAESRDVERQLFLTDLQVVLDLIRIGYGVASRDPDS